MAHKAVSEWLGELDTHLIYDADFLAENFKTETGKKPCWQTYGYKTMCDRIKRRGKGGNLDGEPGDRFAETYVVAAALYCEYGNSEAPELYGMGSQVRAWNEGIKAAGH